MERQHRVQIEVPAETDYHVIYHHAIIYSFIPFQPNSINKKRKKIVLDTQLQAPNVVSKGTTQTL